MRSSSLGRKSSTTAVRVSQLDREDKRLSSRSESRISTYSRHVQQQSSGEGSQIPKPKIRSSSADRGSLAKRSNLKAPTKMSLLQTPVTPANVGRFHADLPTGLRGRSPTPDRASNLGTGSGQKKDSRPLNDKNYQTLMLQRIDNFFRDMNQSMILNNNGSLKPVIIKNFVAASDYLLKLLRFKQDVTITNYMEELPKIAKKIHYPGMMAKSWLKTANTMHSWPHVLAWLSWLVEMCESMEIAREDFQIEQIPFISEGDGEAINRSQFTKMIEAYILWNEGQLEDEAATFDEYVEKIADQCGASAADLAAAEAELAEAEREYAEAEKKNNEVQEIQDQLLEKLQALKKDEEKSAAYEQSQIDFLNSEKLEIKEIHKKEKFWIEEEKKHLQLHVQLNSAIQQQTLSVEDRDKIMNQCVELQNYIAQFNHHLEEINNELWSLQMKNSNMRDKLSKAVLAYNRDLMISEYQNTNELKLPESGIGNADFIDVLNKKSEIMTKLMEDQKEEINAIQSSIHAHTIKLESLRGELKMINQAKIEWLSKHDKTKLLLQNLQTRSQEEEASLQDETKKVEDEIKKLSSLPDTKSLEKALSDANEKLEALKRRKLHLEQSAERFFDKFYEAIAQEKIKVSKDIEKLNKKN